MTLKIFEQKSVLLHQLTLNRHLPMKRTHALRLFCTAIILVVVCCITSCKQKVEIKPELLAVKEAVLYLDSMSVYIQGWEPKDSAYVSSDDSALEELIEREQPSHPVYDSLDVSSLHPTQEDYDNAKEVWMTFMELCTADRYSEALADFYESHGDFLLFLKHSTLRYEFYQSVVLPLMIEYEGVEVALDKYIVYLELQQAQAEVSIALGEIQGNNYVPEVYPYILMDLAEKYTVKGDLERGMSLLSNIIASIDILTGNTMLANYTGTSTGAKLQQMAGDNHAARIIWMDYMRHLAANADLAKSKEELEYYMANAESQLHQLYEMSHESKESL